MFDLNGFVKNIGAAIDMADKNGITVHDALKQINAVDQEEKKKREVAMARPSYMDALNQTLSKMASEDKPKLEFIDPKKLKYSSSDVNYDKARKMASDWDKYGKKEVIISKDNYVEDGATIVEAAKIKNKWVRVLRMNYKHTDK